MQRTIRETLGLALATGALLLGGCGGGNTGGDRKGAAPPEPVAQSAVPVTPAPAATPIDTARSDTTRPTVADTAAPAAPGSATAGDSAAGAAASQPPSDMRIEVDVDARKLYVYRGDERVETHSVAVGSRRWPTQRGRWTIRQVVWNPEWIPPDESWAEEREPKKPGDPDNPLGRAQLVYDPPRTVHGTNQPGSIGKAVSHGSIRMTNSTITRLAREVMEAGGAGKDDAWYDQVRENRKVKQVVNLPHPIPIRVR